MKGSITDEQPLLPWSRMHCEASSIGKVAGWGDPWLGWISSRMEWTKD